jgi:hypothetical protein
MWEFGRASDKEALQLVLSFLQITDPDRRAEVVALANRYQRECPSLPVHMPPLVRQDNAPPAAHSL